MSLSDPNELPAPTPASVPAEIAGGVPAWLNPANVWRVAAVLIGTLLGACGMLAWSSYADTFAEARRRGELLVGVLEEHLSRTLDTSAIALSALADQAGDRVDAGDPIRLGPTLSQSLLSLPTLRSVAVTDLQGRVLASSAPEDVGQVVDLAQLGAIPPAGRSGIGRLVAGRHLRDASFDVATVTPDAVRFLPLMRHFVADSGRELLLVGLLNPDGIANYQRLALDHDQDLVWTASLAGELLTIGGDDALETGVPVDGGHAAWLQGVSRLSHGSVEGSGQDRQPRLISYRVSDGWPVVVGVEQRLTVLRRAWWDSMRYPVAISLLAALFVLGLASSAGRNLRVRLAVRQQLDRAQAQIELRERELSVVMRSLQELIFRTDAQGQIRFVNARWSSLPGADTRNPLGLHPAELMDKRWHADVRRLFDTSRSAGVRSAHAVLAERAGSGREIHLDLAVVPLYAQGRLAGFAGSAVDVSERWQAQQELQRQLTFIETLLEISPLPVSMVDPDGRLLRVNQAWCEFFGRSRDEVLGQRADWLLPPAEGLAARDQDRRAMGRDESLRWVARTRHGDGSWRDVVLTKVAVRGPDGRVAGVLSTLMDVSEFREAERVTREARDLAEAASRVKSEFIANVSHELRTPLQSILGFSELGLMRTDAQARMHAVFADIQSAGQRMLALVNDLLDASRLESTVGVMRFERSDIGQAVGSVLRELAPQIERRELQLDDRLDGTGLTAWVDPMRFQQVVRNVLANAIRFSPRGGTIRVEGARLPGARLQLRVRDQGPGVPPLELEAIFEAFVQSSRTRDGSGGTGLGLAICRKILAAHGGSIRATNVEDGGAEFVIELPEHPDDGRPAPGE